MSQAVQEGRPFTATVPGAGTQTLTYVLPLQGTFVVESVVADIDATAAPATRPSVRVLDKSGAVIATKRQGESIPAADTGSATWALRLDGDGSAAATGIEFDKDNQGGYLDVTANNVDPGGRGIWLRDASGGYTRIEAGNARLDLNRVANQALLLGDNATLDGITLAQVLTAANNANLNLFMGGHGGLLSIYTGNGTGFYMQDVTTRVDVGVAGVGDFLGFYGVAPVTRAAHPTTLAQVITLLTNLGLCN